MPDGSVEAVPEPVADAELEAPEVASTPVTPVFRIMAVVDLTVDLPDPFAVVHLIEDEPPARRLDIPIALADATSLAYALGRGGTPKPLTHELFTDVLRRFSIEVVAVRLTGRSVGTYTAEIDLMGGTGHEVVPCRLSDGIALALRQPVAAPLLADERLLEGRADVAPA
jgi:uncharacterized protein